MDRLQPRKARLLVNFFSRRIHRHSLVSSFAEFTKKSQRKIFRLTRNAHYGEPLLAEEVLDDLQGVHSSLRDNSTFSISPTPPPRSAAIRRLHPGRPRRICRPLP